MTRHQALAWFVDLHKQLGLDPKAQFGRNLNVGGVRSMAFRKGLITKEELLESADHLQGDATAATTYRMAKKELRGDGPETGRADRLAARSTQAA